MTNFSEWKSYQEAYNSFKGICESEGIEVCHSGCNKKVVYTLREWLEWDETQAEEAWGNHLDAEGLEPVLNLETAINIGDWQQWGRESLESDYYNLNIEIDEFNHSSIKENPEEEVIRILEKLACQIKEKGLNSTADTYLYDFNGNRVGVVNLGKYN